MQNIPFNDVIQLAKEAGQAIMAIYDRNFAVEEKDDKSPLTEADLASHTAIVQGLEHITPDIPVLSEESSELPWSERRQWNRYWLIDPLDGTKEFIKKNGEFTVNIALVDNGEPVWGVVYAPALEWTYYGGSAQQGSWKEQGGKVHTIEVTELPEDNTGWRIVGSRSHQSEEFKTFIERFDSPTIKSMGSSLKICLVAEGEADLYPRLGPTSEWDTAAAHAVLAGAGGKIVEAESRETLRYNQKDSVLNPFFIAAPMGYKM